MSPRRRAVIRIEGENEIIVELQEKTTTEKSGCIEDAIQCTASMNLYLLNSFLPQFLLIWSDILAEFTDYVSDCYEMTGKESPKRAEREEGLKKTTSVRVRMKTQLAEVLKDWKYFSLLFLNHSGQNYQQHKLQY